MEVLKCLQRFLDLRAKFMDQQKRLEASQDEFGFADFDFDDPALNDLIGFNPSTSNSSQDSREQIQSRDLELARNLKNEVSPALFKLITTIFLPNVGPQDGAPQVHRGDLKLRFVNDLVYCWASCAAVMVQHKLKVRGLLKVPNQTDWAHTWVGADLDKLLSVRRRSLQSNCGHSCSTRMRDAVSYRHCRDRPRCVLEFVGRDCARMDGGSGSAYTLSPACRLDQSHPSCFWLGQCPLR